MTRRAILIDASNVKGERDLPGARVDIHNWQNFLKSPLGGSWSSWQISVLKKPSLAELDRALIQASAGYCFLAFSGHGSEGSVALNDLNEKCSVGRLRPQSKKATVIIDACRGVSEMKSATFLGEARSTEVIANSKEGYATEFSEIVKKSHHRLLESVAGSRFDAELAGSPEGIVTMYSCAKGQGAGEDPEAGGYYTSALLDAANRFLESKGLRSVLSTKEAHDHAASLVPLPQTPEYSPPYLAFPFAVRSISTIRYAF